jgi:hypothetical protein
MTQNAKDKTLVDHKSGIYEVTCKCQSKYLGQTRRRFSTRYNDHLSAIRLNQPTKSAVAVHAIDESHLDFSSTDLKVKKVVTNPGLLDAYESYYIHQHYKLHPDNNLMNTDYGNISSYLFNSV